MAGKAATLPQVKQCNIIGHWQYGCTAVFSTVTGRWGVMNPGVANPDALGGHWADDEEVKDWDVATSPAPKDPPAVEQPEVVAAPGGDQK